jgi:hypothetical protein
VPLRSIPVRRESSPAAGFGCHSESTYCRSDRRHPRRSVEPVAEALRGGARRHGPGHPREEPGSIVIDCPPRPSPSRAGSDPAPVAARMCHAWLALCTRSRPGPAWYRARHRQGRRAPRKLARWPAAILDRGCAQAPGGIVRPGRRNGPPCQPNQETHELGSVASPIKQRSSLAIPDSEEANSAQVTIIDASRSRCRPNAIRRPQSPSAQRIRRGDFANGPVNCHDAGLAAHNTLAGEVTDLSQAVPG